MSRLHKTKGLLIWCVLLVCIALTAVADSSSTLGLADGKDIGDEARPKKLVWGEASNGLQMAVWVSPRRPIVFGVIRNFSRRKIHYCDYLLGNFEFVRLHARKSPSSEWVPIPLKSVKNRPYIGVLLCSSNDTLRAGSEMRSNQTSALYNPRIRYTFDDNLESYQFPSGWEGTIECKISQTIGGGHHEDAYSGTVESPAFTVKLPFDKENMFDDHEEPNKLLQLAVR